MPREIFVFGSNRAGRHGKGAALAAIKEHGAIYGRGFGLQGNSFAIPTKGLRMEVLALESIESYVRQFLDFARLRPDLTFRLTPIGCGLAGYKPVQIAPMFRDAPANVIIPDEFANAL
jgi:hypothetical protein